ncbi:hypothetical protein FQR65_LT18604 [Abscondita terminalis]|nr:hypothetical protein FQR65_LT18604 [Abscondita terminalis]
MMVSRLLLLIATCLGSNLGGKLPSDIKVCRRSDPKLKASALKTPSRTPPKLRNEDSKVALKMNGTKFESGGESFLRINEFHVNFEPHSPIQIRQSF